jgi:hypothetical protein
MFVTNRHGKNTNYKMKFIIQTNLLLKSAAILGTGATLLLGAGIAKAQIGSNWQQFSPDSEIQIETNDDYVEYPGTTTVVNNGGVRYTNKNGIETFMLVNKQSNRVERRVLDDYTDSRQFEGYVMVSGPTDDEKVHQIFCGNPDGPYLLIQCNASGGSLTVDGGGGGTLITGCYGTWVRINSIHDKSANITDIYCNGTLKSQGTWGSGTSYYTKYGCYGTLNTTYAEVQYKNVKLFEAGSGGGGATLPSGNWNLQNEASGLVLNNQGSVTNGSKITQWSQGSSVNLQWTFISTSGGYYQINSVKSGLDAVVQSASTANGAGIIQWSFGSSGNDQWLPQQNSDGSYTFVNLHSGLVLEDPGSSTSTSTQMDQWGSNSGSNQKWKLVSP